MAGSEQSQESTGSAAKKPTISLRQFNPDLILGDEIAPPSGNSAGDSRMAAVGAVSLSLWLCSVLSCSCSLLLLCVASSALLQLLLNMHGSARLTT
eukprot:2755750-Rhodomonas_salina.2